jgi:GNAT superfamily N-acetyltransferase
MSLQFAFLADREDAVPIISRWYDDEWGHLRPGDSIERQRDRIGEYMNRDEIPFILVAIKDDEIVGAGQLKLHEMMELFPDKEHWLGGVYVAADYRGRGYGSLIIGQIVKMAPAYGVQTLHLQTEALDGGLYARLGWKPHARATNRGLEVLVMERQL